MKTSRDVRHGAAPEDPSAIRQMANVNVPMEEMALNVNTLIPAPVTPA